MEQDKKYVIPELVVIYFNDEDIITDSDDDWDVGGGNDSGIA